jgi:hypothetical protein
LALKKKEAGVGIALIVECLPSKQVQVPVVPKKKEEEEERKKERRKAKINLRKRLKKKY